LLGSIPEAWLITKWVTGQDLRQLGSGNLGVANTAVSVARWAGLLVFLIEAAKGMLTVVLVRAVGGSEILVAAGVLATVSGTRWSIWLKGAGGRGNTVGLAALLLIAWPILLASLMVLIVVHLIITHNSFLATRIGLLLWPFIFFAVTRTWWYALFGAALSLIYLQAQRPDTDDRLLIKEHWPSLWSFLTSSRRK
jgi:glycerol-3-phosphate acyltransferase PlsY